MKGWAKWKNFSWFCEFRSLRLGISEDEKVKLGNENIDQVGSFTYLGSIISKDDGRSEGVESRVAKAQYIFHN